MVPFRILLALESQDLNERIKKLLESHFQVETAHDSEDVYHKVHHFHPDLAIMDYSLKIMNPIELYEGIQFLHPQTTYVLCVTQENREVATRIWRKRAIDYIQKPIDESHLEDEILKIVRHIMDIREIEALKARVQELEKQVAALKEGKTASD